MAGAVIRRSSIAGAGIEPQLARKLKLEHAVETRVAVNHFSAFADDKQRRDAVYTVSVSGLAGQIQQHRKRQLLLGRERCRVGAIVIDADRQKFKSIRGLMMPFIECPQYWHLHAARPAPAGPERHDQFLLSMIIRGGDCAAVERGESKIRCDFVYERRSSGALEQGAFKLLCAPGNENRERSKGCDPKCGGRGELHSHFPGEYISSGDLPNP